MNKKKTFLGLSGAVVLITVMIAVWVWSTKPSEGSKQKDIVGSKTISIEVVNSKKESVKYELQTDAEYLKEAMEETEGLSFKVESGMVIEINGEKAVFQEDGAYWGIFVNGEYGQHGIDTQIVEDEDAFKFEYTK